MQAAASAETKGAPFRPAPAKTAKVNCASGSDYFPARPPSPLAPSPPPEASPFRRRRDLARNAAELNASRPRPADEAGGGRLIRNAPDVRDWTVNCCTVLLWKRAWSIRGNEGQGAR
ncbi:hypothetical protein AEB_P1269 [Altererythrobacter sp. B11]|nr:hypothetical protein AEB_P1269 [Altererythrobacter sp. B11]